MENEDIEAALKSLNLDKRKKAIKDIAAFRKMVGEKHGTLPDSAPLIREDRDTRG
jgi:hypothetical protein